jgi:hypothetical protein
VSFGMGGVLGGCLAPVLVDAVLELDDGEVAHLQRKRPVKEDGLSCIRSSSTGSDKIFPTCSRG